MKKPSGEMKYCKAADHVGSRTLPADKFYDTPHVKHCKKCHRRRAQEREEKVRAERKARGLTQRPSQDEKAAAQAEREARRAEANAKPETASVHQSKLDALEVKYVALAHQPERTHIEVSTASGWNGAVDCFLRGPQKAQHNALVRLK